MTDTVTVSSPPTASSERLLTPDALAFVTSLVREFGPKREELLGRRRERWKELAAGASLGFLPETRSVRTRAWSVAGAPRDLDDRRVEITGPVDRKMMINALNSGAKVFMADLEDACSPTWENVIDGQANLIDAVHRNLELRTADKHYRLNDEIATLVVRPRGWHLHEKHVRLADRPIPASLFDFGLYFYHNARALLERGSGPYFYLPKMESHLEARLWNDVFEFAQDALAVPRGSIRATVLIETIWAAFEMDEILYELRDHAAGLNAGRWDYLFSIIKAFRTRDDAVLPDRVQLTMTVPFMRAYTRQLVRTCHRRGAHAIGGMAAFIPSRRDPEVNERAMAKVKEDKLRESGDGFDGTWVAHPDLVPVAQSLFDSAMGESPNQKSREADAAPLSAESETAVASELQTFRVDEGRLTREGARLNVDVGLRYIDAWLQGVGAVAIHNLMEDAATAEISRSQLWQWVTHATPMADDGTMSAKVYGELRDDVVASLRSESSSGSRLDDAVALLDRLVLGDFEEFLTIPGYELLDG